MVIEVKPCICGTEMPDSGNGLFVCSHCDYPHPAGDPCEHCAALRSHTGAKRPAKEEETPEPPAEPSTPQE